MSDFFNAASTSLYYENPYIKDRCLINDSTVSNTQESESKIFQDCNTNEQGTISCKTYKLKNGNSEWLFNE